MKVRLIMSEEGAQRLSVVQPDFPIPLRLGCVMGTEAAIELLQQWNVNLDEILCSHRAWSMHVGHVTSIASKVESTHKKSVSPLHLSAFQIESCKQRLWALTDLDRRLTILLVPSEYRRNSKPGRR